MSRIFVYLDMYFSSAVIFLSYSRGASYKYTHAHTHTHTPVNLASKPVNAPAIPPTKILKPAVNAYFLRGVRMFTLVRG